MRRDSSMAAQSPWPARIAMLWAGIVLAVCLRSYFFPHVHTVYPILANSGLNRAAGRDCDESHPSSNLDTYRYAPLVSGFFVPFSCLPDSLGGVVWRLLQTALFLAAFAWYMRDVWPGRPSSPLKKGTGPLGP